MPLTPGLQIPFGIQPVQAVPVDSWSGPYTGADLATAIAAANSAIPSGIRFQSMEVRLLVGGTSYKYWYKNGTTDSDLVEFSGGGSSSGAFTLTSGIVTSGYIGDSAVLSGNIGSGQIGIYHIASGVISTATLGSGQVVSGNIASGIINQFSLSSGAVNSGHIGNDAVVSGSIASGTIGTFHISQNAINSGQINSGAVSYGNIASGAVTSGMLGNDSVVSGSIASGQIGINHLASGLAFKINNESDNRILTSLASGSNQANAESNLTYDGTTLNIQSTASGSTVFSVDGISGNLFSINDTPYGNNILSVENLSGNLIFAINTEGYQKTVSCLASGQTSNVGIFSVNKTDGNAAFFDYYCKNTLSSSSRAGNISVVWDESNDSIDYTELSTNDINGSTEHLYFSTTIETTGTYSGKMVLSANISSGSWNIKAGARIV